MIRPDRGPDRQLGQRDGAQPVRRRGGADDEVGSAGQRVVHPRGDLLPDGGQRVVGAQRGEERRDDVGEGRARCGDGEVLHPAGRDRGRRLAGRGGLCHEVPRDRQEGPPGGAEREPPVAPVEQVDAEVVLELAQLARQGRLGDVHRAGGRRDRAGVGDGQEVAEGAQLHGDASRAWERCGSGIGQHGMVGCTLGADVAAAVAPSPPRPEEHRCRPPPSSSAVAWSPRSPDRGPRSCSAASSRRSSAGVGTGLPVYIERAGGGILVDVDGNQLIDFGSGIAVTTVGNAAPRVVERVQEQVADFTHTCFMVTPYEEYVAVCEELDELTPGDGTRSARRCSTPAPRRSRTPSRSPGSSPGGGPSSRSTTPTTAGPTSRWR